VERRVGVDWDPAFLDRSPMYAPLAPAAQRLELSSWPTAAELQRLVEDSAGPIRSGGHAALRFLRPEQAGAPPLSYERRIFERGEVVCRPEDWHDLFNALVWLSFPLAKAALNARHVSEMEREVPGQRGRVRDALTLFDEGGLIVASTDGGLLQLIREFRWKELFWTRRADVVARMRFFVFGHALYEKALAPFVGVTATALLVDVEAEFLALDLVSQLAAVDRRVAPIIAAPNRIRSPRDLSPLPVLGVPGWCRDNESEQFYSNTDYFRPGRRETERAEDARRAQAGDAAP
jgi:hypothetical protein